MEPDNYAIRLERLKKQCIVREDMRKMRTKVLEILIGGLWHTTSEERHKGIIECGSILVEPDIPDPERWSTGLGPELYPYVRKLGGVSLFDFRSFSSIGYSEKYPNSNWQEFVPFREAWESAVWIEIDKDAVKEHLISSSKLMEMWSSEEGERPRVMPYIEAAHMGNLSTASVLRRFLVNTDGIEDID